MRLFVQLVVIMRAVSTTSNPEATAALILQKLDAYIRSGALETDLEGKVPGCTLSVDLNAWQMPIGYSLVALQPEDVAPAPTPPANGATPVSTEWLHPMSRRAMRQIKTLSSCLVGGRHLQLPNPTKPDDGWSVCDDCNEAGLNLYFR